jgi:hypothetical protein
MSNVFTAVRLADYLRTTNQSLSLIRLVLYTGEPFYKDLRPLSKAAFGRLSLHGASPPSLDTRYQNNQGTLELATEAKY